jgi:predicted permease
MGNNVIGESILRLVANLGAIAIPLIMLSIVLNTDLTLKAVKKVLPFSLGSISVALILAIIWSFAWKFIPLSPLAKGALFIMAFLPPSLYPSMLAEGLNLADHEQKYAMQLYSVTIFVSIIFLLIFSSFLPKLITLW